MFKSTGNNAHCGHVTDTQCKPDFTAAFDKHWGDKNTTLWPCIRLAGEVASAGKSKEEQKKQAISYLHYLLLARPDLYVAQGLLISNEGVTFLGSVVKAYIAPLLLGRTRHCTSWCMLLSFDFMTQTILWINPTWTWFPLLTE